MIDKSVVKAVVEEWLQDKEYFLVDIEVSPDDKIVVEIDHVDGVWIEAVSYTHLTLPTILRSCRSRWSPYH